jgi:hypothetical protein
MTDEEFKKFIRACYRVQTIIRHLIPKNVKQQY